MWVLQQLQVKCINTYFFLYHVVQSTYTFYNFLLNEQYSEILLNPSGEDRKENEDSMAIYQSEVYGNNQLKMKKNTKKLFGADPIN